MYDNTVIILFIFILFNKSKRFIEFIWWNQKKESIITILSYIGWPVLNNKSMKENLFGWNWFIWAVAGYGRPQAISSSFFSLLSALPNGRKEEKKSAAADAAKRERLRKQSWWPANEMVELVGYELPLLSANALHSNQIALISATAFLV